MKRGTILPAVLTLTLCLALAVGASAQVNVGEASMRLTSTISAGYSADYSNNAPSDHAFTPSGIADLSGSYYNPNFLSFLIEPFYNQSRFNSDSQSIISSGGVNANAGIFSGSHFPGSISYSKIYNSSGNYNVPGLANYTTHGNSDNFAATWGVNLQNLPSLHFGFTDGSNDYSVYGASGTGNEHHDSFSAMAAYQVAGFFLNGGYVYTGSNSLTPQFLTGESAQKTNTSDNTFSFSATHKLPWNGAVAGGVTRSTISSNSEGDTYKTTIDTATGSVNVLPINNLNLAGNIYYTDNLEGNLLSALLNAGVPPQDLATQTSSHSVGLTGSASYDIPSLDLHFHGTANRQQQTFLGEEFISDSYYGGVTYFHNLFGGQFTGTIGLTDTSISPGKQSMLGVNGSVSYAHRIGRWIAAGSFNYAQATQTALAEYSGSNDGYTASIGRKIRRASYWSASASGAKSFLSDQPGATTSSQSYTTSFSIPVFSISGSYSKSTGNAILTPVGLVPTPVPLPAVNPADVVFYHGDSYSVGFGFHPIRGLTVSGIFSKALSDTKSSQVPSNNHNNNLNIIVVYHLRKLDFNGGYFKLNQGFSASGLSPTTEGSYYFGIKRWFNIF